MKKIFSLLLITILLTGCTFSDNTKIVLTTGFGSDEVFRIEDTSCSLSEVMVYLVNMKNEYESSLGSEIWDAKISDDTSMEDRVKEKALSSIAQIKTMVLLAEMNEVYLDESEVELSNNAGAEYYASLNESEIKAMDNVSQETISNLYAEYALANKVYEYIIKDINPEISDDEARTITVEQILIKTYSLDETGQRISMSATDKADAYERAQEILDQIEAGSSFETLMDEYNEADESTISFGKGEKDSAYETAAFNLGNGEVSDIVEMRRAQVFSEHYDEFASKISRDINTSLWESIEIPRDEEVTTDSFFDVYEKYFQ